MKPFSESSEQNKAPILSVLNRHCQHVANVLEVGSGTGQHAVYFAEQFPHLTWYASDQAEYHSGIQQWLASVQRDNIKGPLLLDVNQKQWPVSEMDMIFSANTAHIMSWPSVENLFAGVAETLISNGYFCLYGPFNYGGKFTSESNARFDLWLKQRDIESGVRDFEALQDLAEAAGLALIEDNEMPANNSFLVWKKVVDI